MARVYDVDIGSCYETAVVFNLKKLCACFWYTGFRIRTFHLTNYVPSAKKNFHLTSYSSYSLSFMTLQGADMLQDNYTCN